MDPTEQLDNQQERTTTLVCENNETAPIPTTGDVTTGYQVNILGTEYLGTTSSCYYNFSIDALAAYNDEGWDEPNYSENGVQSDTYDYIDYLTSGNVDTTLQAFQLLGNREGEKKSAKEAKYGSVHVSVHSIETEKQTSCYPSSVVEYIDPDLLIETLFESYADLQDEEGSPQNSPVSSGEEASRIDWLPPGRPCDETLDPSLQISQCYDVNIVGPFYSEGQDNPYKGEFGINAASISYAGEPQPVAALSADFVNEQGDVCVPIWESDSSFLGATYALQAPVPLKEILKTNPEFDLIEAYDLDNQKSIYVGYCDTDGNPLYEPGEAPQVSFHNEWEADGHTLIDASAYLCGKGPEDVSFLAWAQIRFSTAS